MNKEIDKIKFWKDRIDTATKDFFTVYVTGEKDWEFINKYHQEHFKIMSGRILDAGCAYGRNSIFFDNYVGVDFSPDFIKMAKKKCADKDFIQANLKQLPFKDKEFNWAFCVSIKKMIIDNLGKEEWLLIQKELKRVADKLLVLEYEEPRLYEII